MATGVIWWPKLCGNSTEENAFWSTNKTIYTNSPDFTQCFQNTVLAWVPSMYLWICAMFWIPYLNVRRRHGHVSSSRISWLNISKVVIGVLLCVTHLTDLVRAATDYLAVDATDGPVVIVKYTVLLSSMVLATFLLRFEFRRGVISGGVLFFYWLLLLVVDIVTFRSNILHIFYNSQGSPVFDDLFHFVTFYISFACILCQFILSLFADVAALGNSQKSVDMHEMYCEQTPLTDADFLSKQNSPMRSGAEKESPEVKASYLSRLTFFWISKLIFTGYKRELTFNDVWDLRKEDRSDTVLNKFESEWNRELLKHNEQQISESTIGSDLNVVKDGSVSSPQQKKKPSRASVLKAMWKTCGCYYAIGGLYKLIYDLITFANPLLLNKLITFVGSTTVGRDRYIWHGYIYVVGMFVVSMIRTVILQQYWHVCLVTGQRLRTAVIGVIYRKALRLSSTARLTTTAGEIINLMSVDAQNFQEASAFMHMIWSTPLTIGISMYLLWQLMGPSVLAGLGCLLLLVPVNAYVANKSKTLQFAQMKFKDSRMKLLSEVLNGIKVLKLYSWEESFKKNILNIREKELEALETSQYLRALCILSWFMTPYMVALATFAVYVMSSPFNILDANKAFVSLSLINIINYPLSVLPMTISWGAQAYVSLSRIARFLLDEELSPDNVDHDPHTRNAVEVNEGIFAWGRNEHPVLKDINLHVAEGSLVAVVGHVGSGKSSLISALCGEMDILRGKVSIKGSISFVPQQAWIQNTSIRGNIQFAKEYRHDKYNAVLEACALEPDLRILPDGDITEVGEKGINLSGGQKQRISLARAAYQNTDVYFLDDPLSAVDSHVGKHIFEKLIGPNGLLKNKTRVLVTNSVTFLPKMDLIIVLSNGQISEMGAYKDLLSHKGPFADFVTTYLLTDADDSDPEDDELKLPTSKTSSRSNDHAESDSTTVSPKICCFPVNIGVVFGVNKVENLTLNRSR